MGPPLERCAPVVETDRTVARPPRLHIAAAPRFSDRLTDLTLRVSRGGALLGGGDLGDADPVLAIEASELHLRERPVVLGAGGQRDAGNGDLELVVLEALRLVHD